MCRLLATSHTLKQGNNVSPSFTRGTLDRSVFVLFHSKIRAGCRRKHHEPLLEWFPAIINHLWWCCKSCGGDIAMLREKWFSILYHVCNQHTRTEGVLFNTCAHKPLSEAKQRKKKRLQAGMCAEKVILIFIFNVVFSIHLLQQKLCLGYFGCP